MKKITEVDGMHIDVDEEEDEKEGEKGGGWRRRKILAMNVATVLRTKDLVEYKLLICWKRPMSINYAQR